MENQRKNFPSNRLRAYLWRPSKSSLQSTERSDMFLLLLSKVFYSPFCYGVETCSVLAARDVEHKVYFHDEINENRVTLSASCNRSSRDSACVLVFQLWSWRPCFSPWPYPGELWIIFRFTCSKTRPFVDCLLQFILARLVLHWWE